MKLGQAFDPRNNALNAWRLTLAAEVILWHSFLVTGAHLPPVAVRQLLFSVGVDGFFAISGFLITSSWLRDPKARDYFAARGLRILPGFWVCLIVMAFVLAPIGVAIQGGAGTKLITSGASVDYVLSNIAVAMTKLDIGGTPTGIPWPQVWNGSLWTLIWEIMCYTLVAIFGVLGLLKRRWFLPALFVLALAWSATLPPLEIPQIWTLTQVAGRFAVMFLAGALVHRFRDAIPARWSIVAVCVVVVLASGFLPNYRLLGALPLAYAVIVSGALLRNRRLVLRTDLSYGVYIYAFPIQQLLVICGLVHLTPILFFIVATIATLPMAALSWFLIEKPAMRLKARIKRKSAGTPQEPARVESPTASADPEDDRDASGVN
jgi:peptidoglycan/LPS O-acetylase OafA/YrhL